MPKIKCYCENSIDLGQIPNTSEWLFISDISFNAIEPTTDLDKVYTDFKSFYKCSKCERLFVFWDNDLNECTVYKKELNNKSEAPFNTE